MEFDGARGFPLRNTVIKGQVHSRPSAPTLYLFDYDVEKK